MNETKIRIEEYYDGFAIVIGEERFTFDQEESKEQLKDVFAVLGFDVEYEEAY